MRSETVPIVDVVVATLEIVAAVVGKTPLQSATGVEMIVGETENVMRVVVLAIELRLSTGKTRKVIESACPRAAVVANVIP
mmetsp:Transcript_62150/g.165026  ORF Transcript_62150/g.165026 Transcript_62150/m.165026 type:complete len:81 (+) Transcript_62150:766-1008(+)